MSPVLDDVLLHLRKHGPSTLEELRISLGVHEQGVAFVLAALAMGGLLMRAGRPERYRYRLSAKGWSFLNELHPLASRVRRRGAVALPPEKAEGGRSRLPAFGNDPA